MGDPFSATASAAGVISLGLQICQGLASYVWQCKSSSKEIKDLKSEIVGLDDLLEKLSSTLRDAQQAGRWPLSAKFQAARRHIEACEEGIAKLGTTLERAKSVPPSDTRQVLKNTLKRAQYPFRRQTILDLLVKVKRLQENLHTALDSLQLLVILNA